MSARTAAAVPVRRLAAPLAALACAVAGFAAVGAVDPNEPGRYPPCPVLAYTGLACPGCGGLRCVHALAHGDVAAALGANALVVAGTAVFAAVVLRWLLAAARARPPRQSHAPHRPRPPRASHPPHPPHPPPAASPPAGGRPATAAAPPVRRRIPVPVPRPAPALFALVTAFTVLRNLPFGAALAP